jgi:hypothetical protein
MNRSSLVDTDALSHAVTRTPVFVAVVLKELSELIVMELVNGGLF